MNEKYFFLGNFKLVLLLSFILLSCSQKNDNSKLSNEEENTVSLDKEEILFIGNSHTYYNEGIATHLKRFRENDNLNIELIIQDAAFGGFTLQDHLENQTTLNKLNERSWDAIILQENTSIAADELPSTQVAMASFAEMVKQKGTKIFLFMTWPYRDNPDMLTSIRQTYENGRLETGGILVPVGEDWLSIQQNTEVDINLYDQDGVHPSLEGSFYTAAMFYKAIYKKSPSDNSYQAGLGNEVSNYLKTRAD
ncbi:DUF4886 domain-containing protein [Maribacter sp. 2308TA10-17]|uniref:DUF4886 domain-containing protein n=1 Tax=Maribacter sp. 2308TA10-17 TaxID=3386276 RepID=UPI0039BCFC17